MKSIIPALLALLLVSPAWADKAVERPMTAGPEITLNAASHYLDNIVANALASLELVAATPETKQGDWQGIKPYLQQLKADLPGVYFFVLPDGNYYSVDKDYTNLNLRNRAYFDSLFAGNPVKGFPIYSRSTGRKSALVAAPIVVDNKVTGALGTSIFLEELHTRLNQAFALPDNYTWFVLNAEGNTMLDNDSEFIFMNPLTQGSQSMREAITGALKSASGTTQYELDGIRHAYYRKLPNMDWWMFLATIEGEKVQTPPKLKVSLERFVPDLQHSLTQLDASLAKLIAASHVNVEKESGIRKLLRALLEENLNIVEASYIDARGFLRYIEPGDYKNFENVDISNQAHIVAMRTNPRPIFSSGFMAVEHFLAMVISRPVYDRNKHFAGCINLLIRPELMIDALLKKSTIPAEYELWLMQTDGMIIYDQDKAEIGKMLFSDPLYSGYGNLLELGKKIAATPGGEGQYVFLAPEHKEKVIKHAAWQTVRLHGREWRVVLAYRPYENK